MFISKTKKFTPKPFLLQRRVCYGKCSDRHPCCFCLVKYSHRHRSGSTMLEQRTYAYQSHWAMAKTYCFKTESLQKKYHIVYRRYKIPQLKTNIMQCAVV